MTKYSSQSVAEPLQAARRRHHGDDPVRPVGHLHPRRLGPVTPAPRAAAHRHEPTYRRTECPTVGSSSDVPRGAEYDRRFEDLGGNRHGHARRGRARCVLPARHRARCRAAAPAASPSSSPAAATTSSASTSIRPCSRPPAPRRPTSPGSRRDLTDPALRPRPHVRRRGDGRQRPDLRADGHRGTGDRQHGSPCVSGWPPRRRLLASSRRPAAFRPRCPRRRRGASSWRTAGPPGTADPFDPGDAYAVSVHRNPS